MSPVVCGWRAWESGLAVGRVGWKEDKPALTQGRPAPRWVGLGQSAEGLNDIHGGGKANLLSLPSHQDSAWSHATGGPGSPACRLQILDFSASATAEADP